MRIVRVIETSLNFETAHPGFLTSNARERAVLASNFKSLADLQSSVTGTR